MSSASWLKLSKPSVVIDLKFFTEVLVVSSVNSASDTNGCTAGHSNPSCLHKGSGRIRHFSSAAILAMAGFLCACEARLNLSGVEDTLNQPIRRTDQLMVLEHVGFGCI